MKNDEHTKSLARLVANLSNDPDIQLANEAKAVRDSLEADDPSIDHLKHRVHQAVREIVADSRTEREVALTRKLPQNRQLLPPRRDTGLRVPEDTILHVPWSTPNEEILLAARSRQTRPLELVKYKVGDTQLTLRLLTQSDGQHVEVTILDQAGNPSPQLDGARFAPTEPPPVQITKGQAVCNRTAVMTGFRLLAPDGTPIKLTPQP